MKKLSYLGRLGLHGGKFLWTVFVILCSAAVMLVKKHAMNATVGALAAAAEPDEPLYQEDSYGYAARLWGSHPFPDYFADGTPMLDTTDDPEWAALYGKNAGSSW